MKAALFLTIILAMFLVASAAVSDQNRGAATIVIRGGSNGNVSFPHHKHQNALGDCNLCHSLFPQSSESIEKLKIKGKLKKKEVMEKCRTCHTEKADKGEEAGPTSCKGCHQK